MQFEGFPGGTMAKNLPANAGSKRCRFNPWVRKILWSRKWQPTPIFLPGKFHEQRSLAGYSPWVRKESDTTATHTYNLKFSISHIKKVKKTGKINFYILFS